MTRKTTLQIGKSLTQRHDVAGWIQLARTFDAHHKKMLVMLATHDLTGPQFDVLATAFRRDGLTQQEVADNLLVTKGNVALIIDNLETNGLIERRIDHKDGRLRRLYLTQNGRSKLEPVFKSHAKTVKLLWACFSEEQIKCLTALLRTLEANCLTDETTAKLSLLKSFP